MHLVVCTLFSHLCKLKRRRKIEVWKRITDICMYGQIKEIMSLCDIFKRNEKWIECIEIWIRVINTVGSVSCFVPLHTHTHFDVFLRLHLFYFCNCFTRTHTHTAVQSDVHLSDDVNQYIFALCTVTGIESRIFCCIVVFVISVCSPAFNISKAEKQHPFL